MNQAKHYRKNGLNLSFFFIFSGFFGSTNKTTMAVVLSKYFNYLPANIITKYLFAS